METQFTRTEQLIGKSGSDMLAGKRIALFGLGGVGSFAAEALARCGVSLDLFDYDTVSVSNINRQLIALHSTIGRYKTEVMKERISDINPSAEVNTFEVRYSADNAGSFPLVKYDYIIDAIDTVGSKIELIVRAKLAGVPIISCMGTGNKLVAGFEIADIYSTSVCPLAKVMRSELRARNIQSLKVLYSKILPQAGFKNNDGKIVPASISFVPSVAGLMLAGEAVRDLLQTQPD